MWDLIVSVPDHCLSFYFVTIGFDVFKNVVIRTLLLDRQIFQSHFLKEKKEKNNNNKKSKKKKKKQNKNNNNNNKKKKKKKKTTNKNNNNNF